MENLSTKNKSPEFMSSPNSPIFGIFSVLYNQIYSTQAQYSSICCGASNFHGTHTVRSETFAVLNFHGFRGTARHPRKLNPRKSYTTLYVQRYTQESFQRTKKQECRTYTVRFLVRYVDQVILYPHQTLHIRLKSGRQMEKINCNNSH